MDVRNHQRLKVYILGSAVQKIDQSADTSSLDACGNIVGDLQLMFVPFEIH